jgi:hypothetical protein
MNPGLYAFDFDYESLVQIDDYINGRDDDVELKAIEPGVSGREESLEVMINQPIEMTLVGVEEILSEIIPLLEHQTREYVLDTLLQHKEIYHIPEDMGCDIIAMLIGETED